VIRTVQNMIITTPIPPPPIKPWKPMAQRRPFSVQISVLQPYRNKIPAAIRIADTPRLRSVEVVRFILIILSKLKYPFYVALLIDAVKQRFCLIFKAKVVPKDDVETE
jgi:hypothetical protein